MSRLECPECYGNGREKVAWGPGIPTRWEDCETCSARGWVDETEFEAWAEKLRERRASDAYSEADDEVRSARREWGGPA